MHSDMTFLTFEERNMQHIAKTISVPAEGFKTPVITKQLSVYCVYLDLQP